MQIILPVLSGLLTALAFGGKAFSGMVFVSLIPLLLCTNFSRPAPQILLFSFSYHLILLLWLYRLAGLASFFQMAVAVLLIACVMAVVYALPFWIFPCSRPLEWVLLWVLSEFLCCHLGIFSFPWGRLGTILAPMPQHIQIASIVGTLGVSLLILCVNLLLALAIRHKKVGGFLAAAFLLCTNYLYGSVVIAASARDIQEGVQIGVLQGGIGSLQKWQTAPEDTAKHYLALSQRAAEQGAKLIVFPETAIPTFLGKNAVTKPFAELAAHEGVELLVGGFTPCEEKQYNSMLHLPSGERYHKRTLVPFGEFVPFGQRNLLLAGTKQATLQTCFGKAGILICYDSIFPALMRKSVQEGAEFLVVSTNDSWFAETPALHQHQAHAVLRAVESRRYLVRSAATGITCVIAPTGEVIAALPPGAPSLLTAAISPYTNVTPYVQFGDWLALLLLCFFIYKKVSPYRS